VLIAQVPPLVASVFTPGVEQAALGERIDTLVSQHEKERGLYAARFEGRSAFFEPERPPDPVVPRGTEEKVDQQDTGPAPNYSGPLKAVGVSDKVAFASGNTVVWLREGESQQGVRLVRIDGPFWVTVAWTAPATERYRYAEGEYQIPVFEWPGGLFTTVPPEPGAASEIVVPPPVPDDEGAGRNPRGTNDAREMMRRQAEEAARRNREREADEEEAEEDSGEGDEDVIDEEEVDEEEVDDDGDGMEDDGEVDEVEETTEDDETGDDGDGDGAEDDGDGSGDDDREENRR